MSSLPLSRHALSTDADYPRLKDYLIANTGLAYYVDKDEQLATHAARRIAALDLPDCASYLRLLGFDDLDGSELDRLISMLTIGETFFFRHQEAFDALRDVVFPELIRRNRPTRKLRIWSAGCSIGAEPYSIAILLKRDLAHLLAGWDISIIATDINREFLDRAQEGEYEEWAFRSLSDEVKRACFRKSGKSWVIDPQYKDCVSFQYHNLVRDPCPSLRNHVDGFDLILCRNVTIYFSRENVRNLVQELYFSLVDNGWLLVGHSEPNVDVYRSYNAVNLPGVVFYQKSDEEPAAISWTPPMLSPSAPPPFTGPPVPAATQPCTPEFTVTPWLQAEETNGAGRPPSPAGSPDLLSIQQSADQGELGKTARYCEDLLQREKLNSTAHFYYALVLEQMGRRRETQDALRRAIYLDRTFVIAHYYLGQIHRRLNQPKQASRCFRNVLDLLVRMNPEDVVPAADEFTVAGLKQLAQMHIDALQMS